jgi:hypothetical protein
VGDEILESVQVSQNVSSSQTTTYRMAPLLGGGLNPILGFCFPLFSIYFPGEFSIRVETCGSERKQKCGKLWSIYVHSGTLEL